MLGRTEPRLYTPPLVTGPAGPCGCGCALTGATSYGFAVVDFAADVLGEPLDPWQRWVAIHAGELLDDGRPRFRQILILVARQNGKTHLLVVLSLFWLFVERWPLTLGTSTKLDYARESWEKAIEAAETIEALAALIPKNGVRRANGEQCLTTADRCRYKIAASNRTGGRSLSIDRLISDELREQHDWSAYNAAYLAMNARPHGQAFFISNQGDDRSVVLDALRNAALEHIATGKGDARLGLLEYSAPDGADLEDTEAIAQANPNAGRRIDWDTLMGPARRAKAAGGEEEAGHRTEVMCQRVAMLDPAVDSKAWAEGEQPGTLDEHRARVAGCLDVSPDGLHATLVAAAVVADGVVRIEVVESWSGANAVEALRAALTGWVKRVRPRALGWFPGGPAAALATELGKRKEGQSRSPLEVALRRKPEEIREGVAAVCMAFSQDVKAGRVLHSGDDLLTTHVTGSEKLRTGDVWRFSRRGVGHCSAAYAAAGAAHLARLLPAPARRRTVVRSSEGAA